MIDHDNLLKRIGTVPHFKGLPEAALREIVFGGKIENHKAGTVIFHEGDPVAGMYVLFKGQIHLSRLGISGQETIVTIVNPVVMFNEVAIIDGRSNPVTAIASEDSTTWKISYECFQLLLSQYPEMGTGLLNILATRNRLMLNRYEDLFSRSVRARTAKVLLELSDMGDIPIDRTIYPNQKIAALVATAPEVVSRAISAFKEEGFLEASRFQITLHRPEKIAHLAMIEPMVLST